MSHVKLKFRMQTANASDSLNAHCSGESSLHISTTVCAFIKNLYFLVVTSKAVKNRVSGEKRRRRRKGNEKHVGLFDDIFALLHCHSCKQ